MNDPQLTRDAIAGMTPDQIADAYDRGLLDSALRQYAPDEAHLVDRAKHGDVTRADVAALAALGRHDLIAAAVDDRRLNLTTDTTTN